MPVEMTKLKIIIRQISKESIPFFVTKNNKNT